MRISISHVSVAASIALVFATGCSANRVAGVQQVAPQPQPGLSNSITVDFTDPGEANDFAVVDNIGASLQIFDSGVNLAPPEEQLQGGNTEMNGALTHVAKMQPWVAVNTDLGGPDIHLLVFKTNQSGNVTPKRDIGGPNTTLADVGGLAFDSSGDLFETGVGGNDILEFGPAANGNVAPINVISGPATTLSDPQGIAFDNVGNIWVANEGVPSVVEFAAGATGNQAPIKTIAGPKTKFNMIRGITVDPSGFVYVVNERSNSVAVFGPNQSGNAKPIRVLSGPNTQLNIPIGISYLKGFSLIAVANYQGGDILEFAANANGNIAPAFTVSSGLFGPADVAR